MEPRGESREQTLNILIAHSAGMNILFSNFQRIAGSSESALGGEKEWREGLCFFSTVSLSGAFLHVVM